MSVLLPDTEILAFTHLSQAYAFAVDHGDGAELASLFVSDGEIISPRGRFVGHAEIAGIPEMLASLYRCTFHAVFNQCANIDGQAAKGETYCIARHFYETAGSGPLCYEMTIRYLDKFRRGEQGWLLSRWELDVVGEHTFKARALPRP